MRQASRGKNEAEILNEELSEHQEVDEEDYSELGNDSPANQLQQKGFKNGNPKQMKNTSKNKDIRINSRKKQDKTKSNGTTVKPNSNEMTKKKTEFKDKFSKMLDVNQIKDSDSEENEDIIDQSSKNNKNIQEKNIQLAISTNGVGNTPSSMIQNQTIQGTLSQRSTTNAVTNIEGSYIPQSFSLSAANLKFKANYSISSSGKRTKKYATSSAINNYSFKPTVGNIPSSAGGKHGFVQSSNELGSRAVTEPNEMIANAQGIGKQRQNSMSSVASQGGLLSQTNWFAAQRFSGKTSENKPPVRSNTSQGKKPSQYDGFSIKSPSNLQFSNQLIKSNLPSFHDNFFGSAMDQLTMQRPSTTATANTNLEGLGFLSPSRQVLSSQSTRSTGSGQFKFKRLSHLADVARPTTQQSRQSLNGATLVAAKDFNNVSYLAGKQNVTNQAVMKETPLLTGNKHLVQAQLKSQESLNNVYLKMLDEFEVPFEQDFEKIRQKIKELSLQQSEHDSEGVTKQFVIELLKNQLDTRKTDALKRAQQRVPTNRYDVGLLKQWMDLMLLKIYQDSNIGGQEILERSQAVFESCFQEILSQVSVECSDRGDLLNKVWQNQAILHMKLVEEQQTMRLRHEQESLDEITRVHKMYTFEIERLKTELNISEVSRKQLSDRFDILKNNVKYLKKNNKHCNKMLKTLQYDLDFYKKKNEDYEFAAEQMRRELTSTGNVHQNNFDLQLDLIKRSQKQQMNDKQNKHGNTSKSKAIKKPAVPVVLPPNDQLQETNNNNSTGSLSILGNQNTIQQPPSSQQNSLNPLPNPPVIDSALPSSSNDLEKIVAGSETLRNVQTTPYLLDDRTSNPNSLSVVQQSNLQLMNNADLDIEEKEVRASFAQLDVLKEKIVENNNKMVEEHEEDQDSNSESLILEEKGTDMIDWAELFMQEAEIQTKVYMDDIIVRSEIEQTDQQIQVDFKVFSELGIYILDKEVQTTELDPEYEEQMKGFGIKKLEKELDNLDKAEESYDKTIEKYNLPFDVRKALFVYLKQLNKNQEQMQGMLREEIGLKEKYHSENIELKLLQKELILKQESLQHTAEKYVELNKQITIENEELTNDIVQLRRKANKLTTHIGKMQQAQNQLYDETNRFADNIQRSSFITGLVEKVATGADTSQQDIEDIRDKFAAKNDGQLTTSVGPINFSRALGFSEKIGLGTGGHAGVSGSSNTQVSKFSKIKNVVKKLIQMDINSYRNDDEDGASSDSDQHDHDDDDKELADNVDSNVLHSNKRIHVRKSSIPGAGDIREKSNSMVSSSTNIKIKNQPFKFNEPKFERKKQLKISSPNMGNAIILFNKITSKVQKHPAKMTMTKKTLCKYIGLIYQERAKNDLTRNDPFHLSCYDYFMSHFGLKRVAENKVVQLYEAVYFFKGTSLRVRLFGQFLNLFNDLPIDDLEYYLTTLIKLDEESPPFLTTLGQTGEVVHCSFEKMIQTLKRMEEPSNRLFVEKQIGFVQRNKVLSKQNNNYPVVDVDFGMEKVLETYQRIKQGNKDMDRVFGAADLDSDGMIGLYEFMCLCKYVENMGDDRDKLAVAEKVFFQKCDLVNNESGEKALSLEQFVSLSTQKGYFRQDKVSKFLNQSVGKNECQNIEELRKKKDYVFQQLKMRFYRASAFTPFFSSAINNLAKQVKQPGQNDWMNWIAYRILDLESKRILLAWEIQDCLPQEFIDVINKAKEDDVNDLEGEYMGII